MVAGLMAKDGVNYMLFGSMRADGTFWQAVTPTTCCYVCPRFSGRDTTIRGPLQVCPRPVAPVALAVAPK